MLILSRKLNESIVIDGRILVKVVRVEGQIVKLGIQAPPDVPVHRQEIFEEIQRNNQEALTRMRMELPKLPSEGATDLPSRSDDDDDLKPALSLQTASQWEAGVAADQGELKADQETLRSDAISNEASASAPSSERKTSRSRASSSTTRSSPPKPRRTRSVS